jgi:hypothetical protein
MKKLITLITLLFATSTYADHLKSPGSVWFQQVPILCGTPEKIQAYTDHMNLDPVNISLGREGMKANGEPVYMVTYYISKDGTQSAATIDVPDGSERCVLFHSFDLTSVQ